MMVKLSTSSTIKNIYAGGNVENLALQVRALIVASDAYRTAFARSAGLGLSDAAALGHLLHNGAQTPGQIAARVQMTPGATTAMLDRLDAVGYVTRGPNPGDRRSALITLTQSGEQLMRDEFDAFGKAILQAVRDADLTHLREFADAVEQISVSLTARAQKVTQPRKPTPVTHADRSSEPRQQAPVRDTSTAGGSAT
jgi:DNA-binding MarR family transcriptional regulator